MEGGCKPKIGYSSGPNLWVLSSWPSPDLHLTWAWTWARQYDFYSFRFWGGLARHENSGASWLYVHSLENRDGANWIQGGELHRWTMSDVSNILNTRDLGMWNDGPDYYFAFDVDCNQVVLNHILYHSAINWFLETTEFLSGYWGIFQDSGSLHWFCAGQTLQVYIMLHRKR